MIKTGFVLFLLAIAHLAVAQKTEYFKKGLIISGGHHYGREALYIDTLAYQLNNNSLQKPVAGGTIAAGTGKNTWREVSADSLNRFRSRGFGRSGYLYLTYNSAQEENVLLNIQGNSAVYVNGVLHAGDLYASGWLYLPVKLKKGENELFVRTSFQTVASITHPEKPVMISVQDSTLPFVVLGEQNVMMQGAVVVQNTTDQELRNYKIISEVAGKTITTNIPAVPALSIRKVIFGLDASSVGKADKQDCRLTLVNNNKPIDEKAVFLDVVDGAKQYSSTFVSNVDGSLQYYAVTPQANKDKTNAALFLSVHGAGVEAIGQARAYQSKDWGTLVAATNRRPRGFNWEDWGRLDALEVLNIAKDRFKPNPQQIYLTGHSMGGHGTWFLGATYPDKWAAIAPCAGYPTLKEYGSADGKIPDSSRSIPEQMLLRSSNGSDVLKLVNNYQSYGVYILHGDSDHVVSVDYARQMKKVLSNFHPDYSYYEYPGGEHWFGNESVDWSPLFNYFKWHRRPLDSAVNKLDFITASPGISSSYYWASVLQQLHPLQYSSLHLTRNKQRRIITGTTGNIRLLKLSLDGFEGNTPINIILDSLNTISYTTKGGNDSVYLSRDNNTWTVASKPGDYAKGPQRYGTFKDAFNNKMVFVYSTKGTKDENDWSLNKARYDAETWYYRGNGAVDIIADKEFTPAKFANRGVIIYGNKSTNAAWNSLLRDSPIQVDRNNITAGSERWTGNNLAAYFVYPQKNSAIASVAVVSGTGLEGMKAADANQYFAGGSGFPDFMIFGSGMLTNGIKDLKMAGFFDNNWKLNSDEMVSNF